MTGPSTETSTIDQLIINSPYEEPHEHWRYHRETRYSPAKQGRRKAGYVRASEKSSSYRRSRRFRRTAAREPDPAPRQDMARGGLSGRDAESQSACLQHWRDPEQRDSNRRFFFCQLEAIETLIWLAEAPASERVGIEIPGDGGPFDAALLQDGDGLGQDDSDGDADCVAGAEQGYLSAGQAILEEHSC